MRNSILEYAPLTSRIGFIKANMNDITDEYNQWMSMICNENGSVLIRNECIVDINSLSDVMQPLSTPLATKFLFMQTNSEWVAYFDNSINGSDASSIISVFTEKLKCSGIAIASIPHTMPNKITKDSKGQFGATIFEYKDGERNILRTIYVSNDGGKWVFGQSGSPLVFEQNEAYNNKNKKEKFTEKMLNAYLSYFGINLIDSNFYKTDKKSILFQRKNGLPASQTYYTLDQIRSSFC